MGCGGRARASGAARLHMVCPCRRAFGGLAQAATGARMRTRLGCALQSRLPPALHVSQGERTLPSHAACAAGLVGGTCRPLWGGGSSLQPCSPSGGCAWGGGCWGGVCVGARVCTRARHVVAACWASPAEGAGRRPARPAATTVMQGCVRCTRPQCFCNPLLMPAARNPAVRCRHVGSFFHFGPNPLVG